MFGIKDLLQGAYDRFANRLSVTIDGYQLTQVKIESVVGRESAVLRYVLFKRDYSDEVMDVQLGN